MYTTHVVIHKLLKGRDLWLYVLETFHLIIDNVVIFLKNARSAGLLVVRLLVAAKTIGGREEAGVPPVDQWNIPTSPSASNTLSARVSKN